jgi:hypothetical protein
VYPRTAALTVQACSDADRARTDRAPEPALARHCFGLGSACVSRQLFGEE